MKQIFMSLFIVLLAILFSRFNTMYHSGLIFKRYITIKNKKLANLLIGNINPDLPKNKNEKVYTDRLLVQGVIFSCLTAIFSIGLFVCLLLKNEYQEFFFDIVFSIAVFASGFNSFNISRYKIQTAKNKKSAIFIRVLCVCGWVLAGALLIVAAFISLR